MSETRKLRVSEVKKIIHGLYKDLKKAESELASMQKKIDDAGPDSPNLLDLQIKKRKAVDKVDSTAQALDSARNVAKDSWVSGEVTDG